MNCLPGLLYFDLTFCIHVYRVCSSSWMGDVWNAEVVDKLLILFCFILQTGSLPSWTGSRMNKASSKYFSCSKTPSLQTQQPSVLYKMYPWNNQSCSASAWFEEEMGITYSGMRERVGTKLLWYEVLEYCIWCFEQSLRNLTACQT